jgi:mRNA-degrading endonuclease toxin of MazEF toxin-antitoxin module
MKRGDVVLVDFRFSDGMGSKLRPALVIQADALNRSRDDTILAAISRTQRFAHTEVLVDVTTTDGQQSGLRHTSVIDCANLGTFDQQLIHHTLGALPLSLIQQVDACLKTALGTP